MLETRNLSQVTRRRAWFVLELAYGYVLTRQLVAGLCCRLSKTKGVTAHGQWPHVRGWWLIVAACRDTCDRWAMVASGR